MPWTFWTPLSRPARGREHRFVPHSGGHERLESFRKLTTPVKVFPFPIEER